jgi:hypothetical protein
MVTTLYLNTRGAIPRQNWIVRRKPRWNAYNDANDATDARASRSRILRTEYGGLNTDARLVIIAGNGATEMAERDRTRRFVALPSLGGVDALSLHIAMSMMPLIPR